MNFFERPVEPSASQIEKPELPIDAFLPQIRELLAHNQAVIIVAETGAGKSLRVPQALAEAGYLPIVTQPRRISARSLAGRCAQEMGTTVGDEVGYATALDQCASPFTKILYCTDGLALVKHIREATLDPLTVLVLDEAHEPGLNNEMLLAWSRVQMQRDPDFKVVVMSATMDKDNLSRFLGNAPVVEVPGRQFQITDLPPGPDRVLDTIEDLRQGRDVMTFEPGRGEIEDFIERLRDSGIDAEILPLHADLLPEEQQACLKKYDRPKCIVSTNVGETSITPDVDVVNDSGMERRNEIHDGVEGLYLNPISHANAKQRRGRTGRTKPGIYRDYCPVSADRRAAFPTPEIERTHLDQAVLRMAREGLDMERVRFFHQPERPRIRAAKEMLHALGCLDFHGKVTPLGDRVASLPVSARVGKMLLEAHERKVSEKMLVVAGLIETGGILNRRELDRSQDARAHSESDLLGEVRLFKIGCAIVGRQDLEPAVRKELLEAVGIAPRSFFKALDAVQHITDMFRATIGEPSSEGDRQQLLKAIISGLADQVYSYDPRRDVYVSVTGRGIPRKLSRNSVFVGDPPPLVVATPFDLDTGARVLNLIESVTKVEPKMAREVLPKIFHQGDGDSMDVVQKRAGRRR
jgi:HrpA-like RNA helicase